MVQATATQKNSLLESPGVVHDGCGVNLKESSEVPPENFQFVLQICLCMDDGCCVCDTLRK
jgi:hypothetical protein